MFEYTALVDAPIQRFTGIVTGADPVDDRVQLDVPPSTEPSAVMAVPPPAPTRPSEPRPVPASSPALVPALLAIAAAGITAMWWLRRDSHGR